MKTAMRAITKPMAPTTNTSPLMRPRAAMPRVKRNRNAPQTSTAPYPIPNCRSSRGPKARSRTASSQPEMPIANPWPRVAARPRTPTPIRPLANTGSWGSRRQSASGASRRGTTGSSHQLVMGNGLDESGRSLAPEGEPGDPVEAPETVVDGIPRQDREPDPAGRGPIALRLDRSRSREVDRSRRDNRSTPGGPGADGDRSHRPPPPPAPPVFTRLQPGGGETDHHRVAARRTSGVPRRAAPVHDGGRGAGRGGRIPAPRPGRSRDAGRYWGRLFTSASHLESRRFRSADDPYLAKS